MSSTAQCSVCVCVCARSFKKHTMKRPTEDGPPIDPVLAQLDALINGTTAPPPTKVVRTEEPIVAVNPVLAQLDALINPGAGTVPPIHFATPNALVLPLPPPPPLLAALEPTPEPTPEPRGPPGLLREFGGVMGYIATLRADAKDAAAGSSL